MCTRAQSCDSHKHAATHACMHAHMHAHAHTHAHYHTHTHPMGETLRLGRKGTKKETTLKSLSQLRFLHATSPSLHLSPCKNLSWDKDLKVASFLVPFLPRRRVSPMGVDAEPTQVSEHRQSEEMATSQGRWAGSFCLNLATHLIEASAHAQHRQSTQTSAQP